MVFNIGFFLLLTLLSRETFCFNLPSSAKPTRYVDRLYMSASPKLTIGTRGSPLALAQAYETKRLLQLHFSELSGEDDIQIKKIMTKVTLWFSLNKVIDLI